MGEFDKFLTLRRPFLRALYHQIEVNTNIEEIFESNRNFILHRKPTHNALIVGCGNLKQSKIKIPHIDCGHYTVDVDYRSRHSHENCDTIDQDFARNPTIVGNFFDLNGAMFESYRWKTIVFEGVD